jgi:hypothetical protein
MRARVALALAPLLLAAVAAHAQDAAAPAPGAAAPKPAAPAKPGLDGSKALVCDLVEAAQCDGAAVCTDVTPAQIDLPGPVHVDFAGKRLHSTDGQRTSPIVAVETGEGLLLLQGHDDGRGWTMVIDRANGHLSATIADAEGAFVLAGACAPK